MIPISSVLESREQHFIDTLQLLETQHFTLGGNWDYDKGFFDRPLDEAHKVWLRIPFEVTNGNIDNEATDNEALIRLGTPYVLKHEYREGNDPEASVRVAGALFDQFQSPSNADAEVEPHWIEEAKQALNATEQLFPS
ncbi:YugN-like family protein [Paenibacillus alkaliterrae]|uniref:YugN family protein n=1 Tax=Paenibacillus alkaliterrae TaxID=320909 RepID=UPI001F2117C5|nr:YugN family protein [Paenibacillus alkaliterrae]MCF2940283.1 YugN-like family protein [Paenibacillus alkaliterrae]